MEATVLSGRNEEACKPWKILTVEDDQAYQKALINTLKVLNYGTREVEILKANTAQEAASMLATNQDISVILLDVVMETDDAGLRLVRSIRDGIGNSLVRIVLLTGQPGMMPLDDLMVSYDIDDYWNKSDLTHDHLQTIVLSNLRTWEQLRKTHQARQGFQMLIEASQRISNKYDLKAYTQAILEEIMRLFNTQSGGIVCMVHEPSAGLDESLVYAAVGDFMPWSNQYLNSLNIDPALRQKLQQSYQNQCHIIDCPSSVLFFSSEDVDHKEYLVVAQFDDPLLDYQIDMLEVFGENINAGFRNVALHNRLSELAYYDAVTGLHNKNWLLRQMSGLTPAERRDAKLMMLHVEELAYTEVLFGVEFGRTLMLHLAAYYKASFIKVIDIAIYERDTFMVLVHDACDYSRSELEPILHPKVHIEDGMHILGITASLVKLSDMEGRTPIDIVGVCKSLLEQAKHSHEDLKTFDVDEHDAFRERYALLGKLRLGLLENEFYPVLQPKVALQSGALLGFEVLARWRDQEGCEIYPDQFIPLAESTGLIDQLDEQITRKACQASLQLAQAGINAPLAVNVSGVEISRPEFSESFKRCLHEEHVSSQALVLEVTETQLMQEGPTALTQLQACQSLGIKVSLDDFGAGYSSLAYLSILPVSELKIDRQFINRMLQSEQDQQIVQMIIDLGHLLNLHVIAEGIETSEQYQALKDMGCDAGQGYFIARPMLLEQAINWSLDRLKHASGS
ncbi:EAL domain-containing protein [Marinomonas ostreistagni]|uniref:EAL domain-containing response regulator n=1 Tax=Marinomonas ostreistagni TaxID=359209 RepID=UPI0019517885|nr:EAL domain-containing protein [Marinomonas ostreistagni]MBM6550581.1 EAL domain-containing protein [Marinomonas ostreistagni]